MTSWLGSDRVVVRVVERGPWFRAIPRQVSTSAFQPSTTNLAPARAGDERRSESNAQLTIAITLLITLAHRRLRGQEIVLDERIVLDTKSLIQHHDGQSQRRSATLRAGPGVVRAVPAGDLRQPAQTKVLDQAARVGGSRAQCDPAAQLPLRVRRGQQREHACGQPVGV